MGEGEFREVCPMSESVQGVSLIWVDPSLGSDIYEVLWSHDIIDKEHPVTEWLEQVDMKDNLGDMSDLGPGYWTVHWSYASGRGPDYYDEEGYHWDGWWCEVWVDEVVRTPENVIQAYLREECCPWVGEEECETLQAPDETEHEIEYRSVSGFLRQPPKPPEFPKCQIVGCGFRIVAHP